MERREAIIRGPYMQTKRPKVKFLNILKITNNLIMYSFVKTSHAKKNQNNLHLRFNPIVSLI